MDGTQERQSAERIEMGRALREQTPRQAHADYQLSPNDRDPIAILEESNQGRVPDLVPIRYGRMLKDPFAFLRGSAALMAHDLSSTPVSGIQVQACGDCHLANFGLFATPERNLVFDLNDFDETLPAPWEWDMKRLAASFVVAGRSRGFSDRANKQAGARLGSLLPDAPARVCENACARRVVFAPRRPDLDRHRPRCQSSRISQTHRCQSACLGGRVFVPQDHRCERWSPPYRRSTAARLPLYPSSMTRKSSCENCSPTTGIPCRPPAHAFRSLSI